MSTTYAERRYMNSKAGRRAALMGTLQSLGFTWDEAHSLIRIEMTLHRWAERECGDGSDWGLQRDEKGVAWLRYHGEHRGTYAFRDRKDRVPDQPGILSKFVAFYHQTDCRGAALYIIRPGDIPEGQTIESSYSRGVCVCGR